MDRAELDRLEADLDTDRLPKVTPPPLFHYTDAAGLKGIIEKRTIWATDYRFLNDKREIRIGEDLLEDVATKLAAEWRRGTPEHGLLTEFVARFPEDRLTKIRSIYIASFSAEGDLLSQWRAYGATGGGYSLGLSHFSLPNTDEGAPIGADLFPCEYHEERFRDEAEKRLRWLVANFSQALERFGTNALRELTPRFVALLFRHAMFLALTFKHVAFEEEREWRLVGLADSRDPDVEVLFRPTIIGVVPYLELPLTKPTDRLQIAKLYVGPMHEPERGCATAQLLLHRHGYRGDDLVAASSVPFRGTR